MTRVDPDVAALALAGVFGLGSVPKLAGAEASRAVARRLDVPEGMFRVVGAAELAGATGLVAGVTVARPLGAAAAGGLTLLAACGLVAHRRAGEPVAAYLPAVVLGSATAWLAVALS